jgi:hypothetical protein
MSTPINNLSSGPLYQADGATTYQQRRQSFEALAQALQSNDLTAAKQAYTALAQTIPSGAGQPNNPFAQIGQALQSNDLPAAQNAFAALQARHKHHHHHGNPQPDAAPTGSPQPSTASDASNKIDISA